MLTAKTLLTPPKFRILETTSHSTSDLRGTVYKQRRQVDERTLRKEFFSFFCSSMR